MRVGWVKETVRAEPRRRWAAGVAIGALLLGGAIASSLIFTGAGQAQQTPSADIELSSSLFDSVAPLTAAPSSPIRSPSLNDPIGFADSRDLNADGNPDLVLASSGRVAVYTGDGTGAFEVEQVKLLETEQVDEDEEEKEASGDQDQDEADESDAVSEVQSIQVPDNLRFLILSGTLADLNGDGHPDLVLFADVADTDAGRAETRLYVLLNDGSGAFEAVRPTRTLAEQPLESERAVDAFRLAPADIDQDGTTDLALVETGPVSDANPPVRWLPGNGDGTFKEGRALELGLTADRRVVDASARDVNGDGRTDLALHLDKALRVALVQPDGTLATRTALQVEGEDVRLRDVAFLDADGDGRLDVASLDNRAAVQVHRQTADGSFERIGATSLQAFPESLDAGDFNGDGTADLALVFGNQQRLALALGDGNGQFTLEDSIDYHLNLPASAPAIRVAELTGDGRDDVLASGAGLLSVLIHESDPQGLTRLSLDGSSLLGAADLDGDGRRDLIAGVGSSVKALWQNGQGGFARQPLAALPGGVDLLASGAAVQMDDDPDDEFAVLGARGQEPRGQLAVIDGGSARAEGEVLAAATFRLEGVPTVAAGDLDGDGRSELVVPQEDAVAVWRLDDQNELRSQRFAIDGGKLSLVEALDLTGDGTAELAGVVTDQAAEVRIYRLDGDRLQNLGTAASLNAAPLALATGELTGDGINDLGLLSLELTVQQDGSQPSGEISGARLTAVSESDDGGFAATDFSIPDWKTNSSAFPFTGLALGDFTRDGTPDFAFSRQAPAPPVRVLAGTGAIGQFDDPSPVPCQAGPVFGADLNGDGTAELITATTNVNPHACVFGTGGITR